MRGAFSLAAFGGWIDFFSPSLIQWESKQRINSLLCQKKKISNSQENVRLLFLLSGVGMLVLGSLPPSAQMGMRVFPSEDDRTRMVPGPWLGAAPAYSECTAKGRCTSCGKRGKALQSNKPLTWLITVASRSLLGSAFFQYPSKIKVKEKKKKKNYVDKLSRKENMRRWNMLTKLYRTESRWMVIDLTK